jgi:hypothetical protein
MQGINREFFDNTLIAAKNRPENIYVLSPLRDRETKFPAERNREQIRAEQGP